MRSEFSSPFSQIVGVSKSIRKVCEQARQVSRTTATVLLLGDSGTGKELFARAIHEASGRSRGMIVGLCSSLRGELAEVILHGQEFHHNDSRAKGFPKPGWFEQADGSSLFLDEVAEIPLQVQPSLLRALQERQVQRWLGHEWIPTRFRLIAATNRNLEAMVNDGEFREDLYYRLNVVPLRIPALRDRREDIPLLAIHFLGYFCKLHERQRRLKDGVVEHLMQYAWPGNVRELSNAIERGVLLSVDETIVIEDLGLGKEVVHRDRTSISRFDASEAEVLRQAIEENGGNRAKTAKALGISARNLRYKVARLRRLGLL
jgi:DNA-binding NtrC family response regulator